MPRNKVAIIYTFLIITTLAAFWRVNYCDFVGDDCAYITQNTHIMNGVTRSAISWAFTNIYANFWHPLTMISHMLDVQLFGVNPRGHHLTNLLLHVANTLLLFFFLNRTTKAPWKSAFAAALFAVHPLNVESVAWVSERKNVLSTFFWVLTMVAYASYAERPRRRTYLVTLALFIMGLMAKPMLVTLPFAMLLLDYWPLQRFGQKRAAVATEAEPHNPRSLNKRGPAPRVKPPSQAIESDTAAREHKHGWAAVLPLIIEKIPFFILIPPFSVLAYIAEGKEVTHLPWNVRISNALVSYFIYIGKMFWPTDLSAFYPHPGLWPFWQAAGAGLLLAAASTTVALTARRLPYLAFGWLWFVGTLVPVSGIVQIDFFGRADRFTYIPLIGLFIVVAWGAPEFLKGWRHCREALVASAALVLSSLSIVTWIQVGYWRNNISLYDHSLETTSHNYIVHRCRGIEYARLGNYRLAINDYDVAIEINPADAVAYLSRGNAYLELKNYPQAIADYNNAIKIAPHYSGAYVNLGQAYSLIGNFMQAISDYDRAIEINPKYAQAYNERGNAYAALGNQKHAIVDFDRAIEIDSKFALAYYNRGNAYAIQGNEKQAIMNYDVAIAINSKFADAYYDRGVAYRKLANYKQAIKDYDKAIELNSKYFDAYYSRGNSYYDLGNYRQAISDYDRAIEMNPTYADAYNNRGVAYTRLGNWNQAIGDLQTAAKLGSEGAKNLLRSQGISW